MIAKILRELEPNGVFHTSIGQSTFPGDDPNLIYQAFCWLKNEGFVHHEGSSGTTYVGVTLSSKGYAALGNQRFFEGKLSGSEVAERVSNGVSPYGRAGEFLGGLAGGFLNTQ